MSKITDSQPAVVEVDQAIAELDEQRAAYLERSADARTEHEAAIAEWDDARLAALANGQLPPPRPVEPVAADVHNDMVATFLARERHLRDQRIRAIADSFDAIREEATTQAADAYADAKTAAADLRTAASRLSQVREAVLQARRAVDDRAGQRNDYPASTVAPETLIGWPDDVDPLNGVTEPPRKLGMTRTYVEQPDVPEPSMEAQTAHWKARPSSVPMGPRRR